MPRVGWSYLIVTRDDRAVPAFCGSDGCAYASEKEMLSELGATGWELMFIRDVGATPLYYFKRSRT